MINKKPLVYIAGPITTGGGVKFVQNIRKACILGDELHKKGFAIFVPHWNVMHEFIIDGLGYEDFMEMDDQILQRCDVIFRMSEPSEGADREVLRAIEFKIPVFTNLQDIIAWKTFIYEENKRVTIGEFSSDGYTAK